MFKNACGDLAKKSSGKTAYGSRKGKKKGYLNRDSLLVEYSGLEPLTSTLPVSRSSQMS